MDINKFYVFLKNDKNLQSVVADVSANSLLIRFRFKTNSIVNIEGLKAKCDITITENKHGTTMSFRCLSSVSGQLPINADQILNHSIRKLMKETGFLQNLKLLRFLNGMRFSITNKKPLHTFAINMPYYNQERISSAVISKELKKKYNLQESDIKYLKSLIPAKEYFVNRFELNNMIETHQGHLTKETKELLELNYRY